MGQSFDLNFSLSMTEEWENIYLKTVPTLIHFGISSVQLSLAPFQRIDNAVLSNIFLDDEKRMLVYCKMIVN